MRIVNYVIGWPADRFPNGVVSATASLAPALRRAGHEAHILSYYGAPDGVDPMVSYVHAEIGPGIPILRALASRIAPRRETLDGAPRNIARRLNEVPELKTADIVEMEESFGWSRIVATRVSAPVVTRLHGPYFLTGAAGKDEPFSAFERERVRREGAAIKLAGAMTAPSQFVLDAVRNYYACDLANAVVIPNAARPANSAMIWRLAEADANEILFVGRFDQIKGADILLRAFADLAARRPQVRLTFAGPNDRPMRIAGKSVGCKDFIREIMPPEAAARVNFLGRIPLSALGELRKRAFLTVIASRIEVFANVMLEALAHGSPVVATRVGGIPEIVRDGTEAILVPGEDPGALATAMAALLDRPDFAARLGESGRRRADTEYAPDRVAAITIENYRDVLARAQTARVPRRAGAR